MKELIPVPETPLEHQADFSQTAQAVYIAAAERTFQGVIPLLFVDKPLSAITFTVRRVNDGVWGRPAATETLVGRPISLGRSKELLKMPQYANGEQHVNEYYRALGARMNQTLLDGSFSPRDSLPDGAVDSQYASTDAKGRTLWFTASHEHEATKAKLAAAQAFADEALDYVYSEAFEADDAARKEQYDADPLKHRHPDYMLSHYFYVAYAADLPLSGREPRVFLEDYAAKMMMMGIAAVRQAAEMPEDEDGLERVEALHQSASAYQAAFRRAMAHLE